MTSYDDGAATPSRASLGTTPAPMLETVPLRHPWRWVSAVLVVAFLGFLAHSVIVNPEMRWDLVKQYLFDHDVLHGVLMTIELTVGATVIGIVLGVVVAVMRQSPNGVLQAAAGFYIWLFRGTPVLVQLLFWFYIPLVFKTFSLGIPFGHTFIAWDSSTVITPTVAALLGLGLNEAAYMAEIVRAGLLSVEQGQTEAAAAIGMRRPQIMRRIVLPQAMRVIIPPVGNETISMLKTTSIVFAVAGTELLSVVTVIYASNYQNIPLLMVATVWYIVLSSVLSVGQYFVERHYARGAARAMTEPLLMRVVRSVFSPPRRARLDGGRP
jgi:polar amino acid transport system permease protein